MAVCYDTALYCLSILPFVESCLLMFRDSCIVIFWDNAVFVCAGAGLVCGLSWVNVPVAQRSGAL